MNKDELLLTDDDMRRLVRSGMEPNFRSLAGLFDDAAKHGGMAYYYKTSSGMEIWQKNAIYRSVEIDYRLSDLQLAKLQQVVINCTGDALQLAARMGYQNVENK